jgi:hypothetical protein
MKFAEAIKLAENGADIRHPNMARGYIIHAEDGKLVSYNPFNAEKNDFIPTEQDQSREDWIAGHGLAAL